MLRVSEGVFEGVFEAGDRPCNGTSPYLVTEGGGTILLTGLSERPLGELARVIFMGIEVLERNSVK